MRPLTIEETLEAAGQGDMVCLLEPRDLSSAIARTHETLGIEKPRAVVYKKIVLFSHQVNFMPYLALTGLFPLLEKLAKIGGTVSQTIEPLIVLIDTDVCNDARFKNAWLPGIRSDCGHVAFGASTKGKNDQFTLIRDTSPVSEIELATCLARAENIIVEVLRKSSKLDFRAGRQRLRAELSELTKVGANKRTMAEFNGAILTHWISKFCGMSFNYVYSSMLYPLMSAHVERVWETLNWQESHFKDNLWQICCCGARLSFSAHECPVCNQALLGPDHPKDVFELFGRRYIPKIYLDNVLDALVLGKMCGIMYPSGRQHLDVSDQLLKDAGLVPPPTLLWRIKGNYMSPFDFVPADGKVTKLGNECRFSTLFYNTVYGESLWDAFTSQINADTNLETLIINPIL